MANSTVTFFPVGEKNGGMTLIKLNDSSKTNILIDCAIGDDSIADHCDVNQELRDRLPADSNGRPYVDAFILTGQASEWKYLSITPETIEIHSAEDLIGLNTHQTTDKLKERHGGKMSVACIGPAGERKALLSCIINDKGRAAGRGGLGAVLGSKKLKAVVVTSEITKSKTPEEEEVRSHVLNLLNHLLF